MILLFMDQRFLQHSFRIGGRVAMQRSATPFFTGSTPVLSSTYIFLKHNNPRKKNYMMLI